MAFLDTNYKRKSAAITSILVLALLFVVFNFGMRYLDPPEEYGLAINYGDLDVGNGTPVTKTAKIVPPKVIQKEKVVKAIEELPTEKVPQTRNMSSFNIKNTATKYIYFIKI